jgi:glycerol uptake facilitator-like aquaporin
MFGILSNLVTSLSTVLPPGLILSLACIPLAKYKYAEIYRKEFIGTLLMVAFTFSPGNWYFQDSLYLAWAAHACAVVAADKIGGGQHVNPAVTVAMYSLGKCDYSEAFMRIAGQMAGGLVAFPLYQAFSDALSLTPLGGPEFNAAKDADGSASAASEFVATALLLVIVYVLNWELNFGKHHYYIKQTLTALGIRFIIEVFPLAGPAINPMLATTWAVFAYGGFPTDEKHYLVYWIAAILGALAASGAYAVYDGCKFFQKKLPIGPIKKKTKAKTPKKKQN